MLNRGLALILLSLALLALPGTALADEARLKVMTRNLYVGSSFSHALAASTPEEFVLGVSRIWSNVRRTDFRTRAGAIAGEIAATRPDVVGLQEVSRWERAAGSGPLAAGGRLPRDPAGRAARPRAVIPTRRGRTGVHGDGARVRGRAAGHAPGSPIATPSSCEPTPAGSTSPAPRARTSRRGCPSRPRSG